MQWRRKLSYQRPADEMVSDMMLAPSHCALEGVIGYQSLEKCTPFVERPLI
jgi:hypothetical protein